MRRISSEIEEQNEQILDLAIHHFCEKGYAKTRMEDIASILQITKTPLYYHFKDKAGLFDAAYRKAMNKVFTADLEIFEKDGCVYDKLTEAFVVCAISSYQLQINEMSQIIIKEGDVLSETEKFMDEIHKKFYEFKTGAMIEAQQNGEIKENVDIDELYAMINACYCGVIAWVGGVGRRGGMSESKKEKLIKHLIGKAFLALKPLYFNEVW